MVQRKVPNKLGIKTLLKSDTQLEYLRPLSPKSHDLKKIMKKQRPAESRPSPPPSLRKKITHDAGARARASPQKQSPNYMKSTTSFDARKEPKTPTPKIDAEKVKPLSSLKVVRTLAKTPSFKPLRPLKKKCSPVILNARRTTCSSTLKDSKFPSYLELSHGGTELEGTSALKVCPYNYCSLNGHHHAPSPPLRCFVSARRRALKNQKSFMLGCLSPRQTKTGVEKNEEIVTEQVIFADEGPETDMVVTPVMEEEENRDFFVEIYSKDREDLEFSPMDWEEGYCSSSCVDDGKNLNSPEIEDDACCEEQFQNTGFESLHNGLQELYDEESVSSGAWSESDGDYDSESDSLDQQLKINHQNEMDEDKILGYEEKTDEHQRMNITTGDHEETTRESETVPDFGGKSPDGPESTDKHHTTIIYNIIQYNISIYFNREKTEHSEPDERVTVQLPATSGEVNEIVTDESSSDTQDSVSTEQLDTRCLDETEEDPKREKYFESDKHPESNEKHAITGEELLDSIDEEPSSKSDEKPAISGADSSMNLKESTRSKKTEKDIDEDSGEYNLRGPNFLPEVADPDAETVDLKHQTIDERKNAEEWMVDFALQQAVTTLAPARKRKVALLVEAFEKVLPTPKFQSHHRHTSIPLTNATTMQACI